MSTSLTNKVTDSQSNPPPVTPAGARKVFTHSGIVPAPPEAVFPLLCPVREYEWLDDWACDVQYTESGAAEKGCAFHTRLQVGESWICSRHEPDEAIQYVVWLQVGWLILDLRLDPLDDATTELHWTRTFTATDPRGAEFIGSMDAATMAAQMKSTHDRLVAHLQPQ